MQSSKKKLMQTLAFWVFFKSQNSIEFTVCDKLIHVFQYFCEKGNSADDGMICHQLDDCCCL
jgi:hypothetical protein